jgi:hypothetical protein
MDLPFCFHHNTAPSEYKLTQVENKGEQMLSWLRAVRQLVGRAQCTVLLPSARVCRPLKTLP